MHIDLEQIYLPAELVIPGVRDRVISTTVLGSRGASRAESIRYLSDVGLIEIRVPVGVRLISPVGVCMVPAGDALPSAAGTPRDPYRQPAEKAAAEMRHQAKPLTVDDLDKAGEYVFTQDEPADAPKPKRKRGRPRKERPTDDIPV